MNLCIKTYKLNVNAVSNYGSVNIGSTLNVCLKRDVPPEREPVPRPPDREPEPPPEEPAEPPLPPGPPSPPGPATPPGSSGTTSRASRRTDAGQAAKGGGSFPSTEPFYVIPRPVIPPVPMVPEHLFGK